MAKGNGNNQAVDVSELGDEEWRGVVQQGGTMALASEEICEMGGMNLWSLLLLLGWTITQEATQNYSFIKSHISTENDIATNGSKMKRPLSDELNDPNLCAPLGDVRIPSCLRVYTNACKSKQPTNQPIKPNC